jgi:carbon monoxide dehydrogenase subunit G
MALATTLYIDAPPARVWQLIDDPMHLPLWMPEVIDTVYPDGRKTDDARGTRFVQRVKDASGIKTYQGKVVAYEPGRHLALTMTETMVTISVGYRLMPYEQGTRLDFTGDLAMNNPLFSMMALAAWPMARAHLSRQISDLKRVAEAAPVLVADAKAADTPVKALTKRASPRTKTPTAKTVRRKLS